MKTAFFTVLVFLALPALAKEVYCSDVTNSAYQLRLVLDSQGYVVQVALSNLDWSGEGQGTLQNAEFIAARGDVFQYKVTSSSKAQVGIEGGAEILTRGAVGIAGIQSAELRTEIGDHMRTDSRYICY